MALWLFPLLLTRPAVHCLLQDLQLVIELCDEGALAEGARYEPSLQLVSDVLPGSQLLVVLSRLGQQLRKALTTLGQVSMAGKRYPGSWDWSSDQHEPIASRLSSL